MRKRVSKLSLRATLQCSYLDGKTPIFDRRTGLLCCTVWHSRNATCSISSLCISQFLRALSHAGWRYTRFDAECEWGVVMSKARLLLLRFSSGNARAFWRRGGEWWLYNIISTDFHVPLEQSTVVELKSVAGSLFVTFFTRIKQLLTRIPKKDFNLRSRLINLPQHSHIKQWLTSSENSTSICL